MKRAVFIAILLAAATGPLAGDDEPTELSPADGQSPQQGTGLLSLPGMTLDLAARKITLQARVGLRQGLLELLVCRENSGRGHETLLVTPALPSDVHAALLALGLSPGLPAKWQPLADGKWQAIPPRGARLAISLQWTDADGQPRQVDATDWLRKVGDGQGLGERQWVFVGSLAMPDGAYAADSTGEVVTVSNFATTLIDVPFESSADNSQLVYQANTEAIPPVGTAVEVVITPLLGGERADYARATIAIDRNGDIHADGKIVPINELDEWAMAFIAVHSKGEAVIHIDPLAMSDRVGHARLELRIGGFYEIHELRMALQGQVMPRTPQQMKAAVGTLEYDLTHLEELLHDPYQQAEDLLAQIEREREELKRLDELWQKYAEQVAQTVEANPPPDQTDDGATDGDDGALDQP